MNYSVALNEIFILLNKILNTLVRRKFGKQFTVRLNSLLFISNRTNIICLYTCCEKILVKSNKPVSINQLIQIKEYLLFNINYILKCVDAECNMEVTDIEVVVT